MDSSPVKATKNECVILQTDVTHQDNMTVRQLPQRSLFVTEETPCTNCEHESDEVLAVKRKRMKAWERSIHRTKNYVGLTRFVFEAWNSMKA